MRVSIALIVLVLDQASKLAVSNWVQVGESRPILGNLVRLTYIHNAGAVFGLTFGGRALHLVLSLVALGLVVSMLARTPAEESRARAGLSLILGGAVGNLIDRLRVGEVIDFLDVGIGSTRWYIFNVADSAVTIGVLALLASYLFQRSPHLGGTEPRGSGPD